MTVLFVGDLHIGKGTSIGKDPIGVGLNSRVEDQKRLLDHITKIALDNFVTHIFIAGDVFQDVNPKSILVKVFFGWINTLVHKCGVEIYIVMGNHDFIRSGRDRVSMLDSLSELDLAKVHIIRDISAFIIAHINFVFVPFCDRKQLEVDTLSEATNLIQTTIKDKIQDLSDHPTIVFGHMMLEGSLWVGDELDESGNEIFLPLDTFKDADFVWMGHNHKWQVLQQTNPHIAHIGSLEKTTFSEKDKHVVLFDSNDCSYTYIKLPCRSLVDIDLSIPPECKNSTECVITELHKIKQSELLDSIVRIKVKLNSHDTETTNKDEIVKKLESFGVFHLSSFNETRDVDRVIVKTAQLDETIDHPKAVDIFIDKINVETQFKLSLSDICKGIIKEYQNTELKG